jgi:hypothetical protein
VPFRAHSQYRRGFETLDPLITRLIGRAQSLTAAIAVACESSKAGCTAEKRQPEIPERSEFQADFENRRIVRLSGFKREGT